MGETRPLSEGRKRGGKGGGEISPKKDGGKEGR